MINYLLSLSLLLCIEEESYIIILFILDILLIVINLIIYDFVYTL
jgi:hypothetical protein